MRLFGATPGSFGQLGYKTPSLSLCLHLKTEESLGLTIIAGSAFPWVMLRAWPLCPAHPCGTVPGPLLLQVHRAAENRARCPHALSESKSACNILFELISPTTRLEWLNIAATGNGF